MITLPEITLIISCLGFLWGILKVYQVRRQNSYSIKSKNKDECDIMTDSNKDDVIIEILRNIQSSIKEEKLHKKEVHETLFKINDTIKKFDSNLDVIRKSTQSALKEQTTQIQNIYVRINNSFDKFDSFLISLQDILVNIHNKISEIKNNNYSS